MKRWLHRKRPMKKHIVMILLAAILATSCSKAPPPQTLSFEVLVQSSPFTETSPPSQDVPNLIVIASPGEISPPIPEFEFSDIMVTQLNAVDYEQYFAVLILVGQITDGTITEVSRTDGKVFIKVKGYTVGPGSYKLKGYSLPYQLISVEKEGPWDIDIEFILEEENGNILGRTKHHIP